MIYHDYQLLSYRVDCQKGVISLELGLPKQSNVSKQKIVFSGVEGYHFKDGMGAIITEIQEKELREFIEENFETFSESYRLYGIPKFWKTSLEEMMQELEGRKVWEIYSAVGFNGYVIASEVYQLKTNPSV